MLSRLKSSLAGAGFAAFMAASSPASAEQVRPVIVERHVIFLVDVSKSVDTDEYHLMMEGIGRALKSETAKNQFDSSVSYALSVVFFSDEATPGFTKIVSNSRQAADFAKEAFYDFEKNEPYPRQLLPGSTGIVRGYLGAQKIMREENFEALSHEILVIGDGQENQFDLPTLKHQQGILNQTFGAVVSAVPILVAPDKEMTPEQLQSHYSDYVITAGRQYYKNERGMKTPLKEGHSYPAYGFPEIERAVSKVIEYALN